MKSLAKLIAIAALLFVGLAPADSQAGVNFYLRIGPPKVNRVKVVRPARPHRHAVWVNGHYRYEHGRYVWVAGYWLKGKPGYVYVQPHWKQTPRGWCFVPGHWVKR